MAEIKIQPKRRGVGVWPWLLLLLLIPLLWYLFKGRRTDDTAATTTRDTTVATAPVGASTVVGATTTSADSLAMGTPGTTPGATAGTGTGGTAITEYGTFIGSTTAARDEAGQHQYTADGLRRLAAAIDASPRGSGASAQTSTMRAMADSIQQTGANNDRHADMTRTAFDAAVAGLRTAGVTSLSGVESAARALKPRTALLAQRTQIQRFFEQARDALATTGGPTPPTTTAPAKP